MITSAASYLVDSVPILGSSVFRVVIFLLILTAWFLYPLFGQRRHIPGPWLSKVSSLHLCFYDLTYCRNDEIQKWHQYYGPVICIAPNEFSVATLDGTKDIYGTTHRWAKSNYFDHFKGYNMRSIFATKPYEDHREKRKLTSAFYQASTIYKIPEIEQHIQERSQAVLKQIRTGKEVDVYSLTDWYALDNITFLVLGPDHCTQAVDTFCPERELLMELKHLQYLGPFRIRYPKLYKHLAQPFGKFIAQLGYLLADEKLEIWCHERIKTAMNDPRLFKSHSLLRHLLEVREGDKNMKQLDYQYIAAEVLDNINAAEATVAVTATYLIWRLTENPMWQERIRQELLALPLRDDGALSFADINSRIPSLEACLREVYRLHPASSGRAERVVPKGGHVLSGVYLPEGAIVTTSVVALHHDENVYQKHDCFLPERWLDNDNQSPNMRDAQLMPFGYGGRICLGKALATMEIKLLIARIYRNYETVMTPISTAASMKQCSTHDAVPKDLKCVVRFQAASTKVL